MRRREELRYVPTQEGIVKQQGPSGQQVNPAKSSVLSDTPWTSGSTMSGSWREPTTCTWN